jgi:hypothetical protein
VVPAVRAGGDAKVAVKTLDAPLLNPGSVVVARTVLVGSAGEPVVVLISTVIGWSVPEQLAQNRAISILARLPVTAGVNV